MGRFYRLFLIFALALFPAFYSKQSGAFESGLIAPDLAYKELRENGSDMSVLDVRTPAEYAAGHIEGSKNINFLGPDFEKEISGLDKDKDILVYCRTGGRSRAAALALRKAGFKKILDLEGGIKAWEASGLPVEK